MEQEMARAIDPPLEASSGDDGAKRQKRRRWIWILVGLCAFAVVSFTVLGLLATLVVPNVLQKFAFASTKKTEVDITSIESALEEFAIANHGKYPDSLQLLVTPDTNGQTFLDATHVPKDPWGREYLYEPPGPGKPHPIVRSYGRDGRPGGEGLDADVDSLSIRAQR